MKDNSSILKKIEAYTFPQSNSQKNGTKNTKNSHKNATEHQKEKSHTKKKDQNTNNVD